jgi:hypothetical protein
MNWFMYVGGGILFVLVFMSLFNSIFASTERIKVLYFFGLIFVWVWISWKFI